MKNSCLRYEAKETFQNIGMCLPEKPYCKWVQKLEPKKAAKWKSCDFTFIFRTCDLLCFTLIFQRALYHLTNHLIIKYEYLKIN